MRLGGMRPTVPRRSSRPQCAAVQHRSTAVRRVSCRNDVPERYCSDHGLALSALRFCRRRHRGSDRHGWRFSDDAVADTAFGNHKKDWLNFHDLRHTAITRFGDENQIYLSTRESEYLLGKRNGKSGRSRYEHLKLVDSIRKKIDVYELNTAVRFAWSDTSFGEWKIKENEREESDTLPDSEREIVGRFRIYEDDGEPHMRPILGGPKAKE